MWTNRSDKNSKKSPPDAGKIKPRQGDSHFKNTNTYDNGVGGKKEGEPAAHFEFTYSPLENIEEAEKLPDKRQKKGKIAKSFRQSSQRILLFKRQKNRQKRIEGLFTGWSGHLGTM